MDHRHQEYYVNANVNAGAVKRCAHINEIMQIIKDMEELG